MLNIVIAMIGCQVFYFAFRDTNLKGKHIKPVVARAAGKAAKVIDRFNRAVLKEA